MKRKIVKEDLNAELSCEQGLVNHNGNIITDDLFIFHGDNGVFRFENSAAAKQFVADTRKALAGKKSNVRVIFDNSGDVIVCYGVRGCVRFWVKEELEYILDAIEITIPEWKKVEKNWLKHVRAD